MNNMQQLIETARKLQQASKGSLRVGQAIMNALHDMDPDMYLAITNTTADCFYNDDNIGNLIVELNERW